MQINHENYWRYINLKFNTCIRDHNWGSLSKVHQSKHGFWLNDDHLWTGCENSCIFKTYEGIHLKFILIRDHNWRSLSMWNIEETMCSVICLALILYIQGQKTLLCRGLIKATSPSKIASFFPQFCPKNSPFQ